MRHSVLYSSPLLYSISIVNVIPGVGFILFWLDEKFCTLNKKNCLHKFKGYLRVFKGNYYAYPPDVSGSTPAGLYT